MAKFRIDSIADLARQLGFTPQDTRLEQLAAAEALLHEVDPSRAYPLDFIIYRVTGYHPKIVESNLLTGLALQHDLGLLIEQVSQTLDLQVTLLSEPILTIEQVSERFNVTSKTIQRWRRKGLAARRFIFADGKRRVGFLVASVERFLSSHQDRTVRAANFSQVTEQEKSDILQRARRLATACHCCTSEIARRIGRQMNRSPLTVAGIVLAHDQQNPAQAIFQQASQPIGDEDRAQIVRSYRRGLSIKQLARRFSRPRSSIYRAIIEERLARLAKKKIKFIDDPLYHQDDAEAAVEEIASQQDLMSDGQAEDQRVPRDLPPDLHALYRTPLLTPAKERALFLKLNFHKFVFVAVRRRIEPQFARARDVNELEAVRRKVVETRNSIIRANLRLVVSVARKHLRPGLPLMELLSEGNLTLMRAVDSFDFHKGNRFSTYATLALMKGFARSVPELLAASKGIRGVDSLEFVADIRSTSAHDRLAQRDEVQDLLARLEPQERDVLRAHFGLAEGPAGTYEQVGQRLGLSKRRVRQIELSALAKLRAVASN